MRENVSFLAATHRSPATITTIHFGPHVKTCRVRQLVHFFSTPYVCRPVPRLWSGTCLNRCSVLAVACVGVLHLRVCVRALRGLARCYFVCFPISISMALLTWPLTRLVVISVIFPPACFHVLLPLC